MKAAGLADQKLKINPNDGSLHKRLARFQSLVGNPAAALAEIEKALKMMPGNSAVWETAIEVYERAGRRVQALQAARKLFEMGGSLELIEKNPDLAALCRDERFAKLVGRKGR
jgi:Flp pilus assembly protein TadD